MNVYIIAEAKRLPAEEIVNRALKVTLFVLVGTVIVAGIFAAAAFSSPASAGHVPDAASLYNRQCAKCHGRDGRSKTSKGRATHARDLTSGEWQDNVSDERIYNSISNGKGKMPAFKKLSESEIDSLVNYVRRLRR